MRQCILCNKKKQNHCFPITKDGCNPDEVCRTCHKISSYVLKKENKETIDNPLSTRINNLNSRIRKDSGENVTIDQILTLWMQQGGECAICYKQLTIQDSTVDHDHSTGRIRGILCGPCNSGLGFFEDNTEKLYNAISYLDSQE